MFESKPRGGSLKTPYKSTARLFNIFAARALSSKKSRASITAAAADLQRLLGEYRISPRYPAPIQAELLA